MPPSSIAHWSNRESPKLGKIFESREVIPFRPVGNRVGAEPRDLFCPPLRPMSARAALPGFAVQALLRRQSDLAAVLPPLGEAIAAGAEIPYSHLEEAIQRVARTPSSSRPACSRGGARSVSSSLQGRPRSPRLFPRFVTFQRFAARKISLVTSEQLPIWSRKTGSAHSRHGRRFRCGRDAIHFRSRIRDVVSRKGGRLRHSCGSSAGVAHHQPHARAPDVVGSGLSSPYHFRARIQSFQTVAAPFSGDLLLPSLARRDSDDRNASVQKIDSWLGGLPRDDGGGPRGAARRGRSARLRGSPPNGQSRSTRSWLGSRNGQWRDNTIPLVTFFRKKIS